MPKTKVAADLQGVIHQLGIIHKARHVSHWWHAISVLVRKASASLSRIHGAKPQSPTARSREHRSR